jgi:protein-S-isoprenylcysteine O-methyltransferase Ste14
LLIQVVVLVLSSGRAVIGELLPFLIAISTGSVANALWLAIFVPDVAEHRSSFSSDTKSWDKPLLLIYFLNNLIIGPMMIGLDVGHLRWHQPSVVLQTVAIPVYLLALVLILWSMKVNQYFEGTARIQTDRSQRVITSGPYLLVRHPGYLGMILGALAAPIIARSMLGFSVSLVSVIVVVTRTCLEDEMLKNELPGYQDYVKNTRFRLIPWVW